MAAANLLICMQPSLGLTLSPSDGRSISPTFRACGRCMMIRALALLGWMHGRPELGLKARIGPLLEYATARAEAFLSGRLEF